MSATKDTTTRVRLNPPPPALMRMLNPLVRRVLTTPALARRTGKIALVELHGRRTGRLLRIPMGLHDINGTPTAFTSRPWRHNFTDATDVTITRRGRTHPATAILVPTPPGHLGTALHQALQSGASPFDLGLKIPKHCHPSVAELDATGLSMIQFQVAEERPPGTRATGSQDAESPVPERTSGTGLFFVGHAAGTLLEVMSTARRSCLTGVTRSARPFRVYAGNWSPPG